MLCSDQLCRAVTVCAAQ
uniref:Uncharacterized protein n=1 Tax=Anguilla anguilla TaxID=7936 RepID=A0A0E9SDY2_ANGAN